MALIDSITGYSLVANSHFSPTAVQVAFENQEERLVSYARQYDGNNCGAAISVALTFGASVMAVSSGSPLSGGLALLGGTALAIFTRASGKVVQHFDREVLRPKVALDNTPT